MNVHTPYPATLADVLSVIDATDVPVSRRRDMISAIKRICEMAGHTPSTVSTKTDELRSMLGKIRPARHDITKKTFSNMKTSLKSALQLAGVIEPMGIGIAKSNAHWGPLLKAIGDDKRLSCGLAAFANWCVLNGIHPTVVSDDHVTRFHDWLERRTLCPKPRNVVRQVPNVWNDARQQVEGWPEIELTPISFRAPFKHLTWDELNDDYRRDAEAYLAMRAAPDLFDENPNTPTRPLAPRTCKLQRDHLRLSASVLVLSGTSIDEITSLAHLVDPEAFKTILRHYHQQAAGKPNAFLVSLAKTLIQVARYHVGVSDEDLQRLKKLAAKLPAVPFDLTPKNKELMQELDSCTLRAKLIFLPDTLLNRAADLLEYPYRCFVDAQVGIAIAILLVAPLRTENLITLSWRRHFSEPDGPRGPLRLHIPAEETKTGKRELIFELPDEVAHRIRWYRRNILPHLNADTHGHLFVTKDGTPKAQETLSDQIIDRIETHVGIHMSGHQFRHLAAKLSLDAHPEDFRTVTDLLGHASPKITQVYAGASSQRASKAYGKIVCEQRDALKLRRKRRTRKRKLAT